MIIYYASVYIIIAVIWFICTYRAVENKCQYGETPKLDYCFIRGLFFPLVIMKKIFEYIIKS